MDYEELIENLKSDYNFIFKPLPNDGWGYSEYVQEKYNLKFVCGSSNGDTYYIITQGNETLIHENFSMFIGKDFVEECCKIHRKCYKIIQKIFREERIKILLNGTNS